MENKFNRQFSEYKNAVVQTYLELKKSGKLAIELEDPKPAKLRDYCLHVLRYRYDKKADKFLRIFFDPKNQCDGDHENAIGWTKPDKFKPLINFLKGEANDTNVNNIKLLAWLMDCKPYEVWKEEIDTPVRKGDDGEWGKETGVSGEEGTPGGEPRGPQTISAEENGETGNGNDGRNPGRPKQPEPSGLTQHNPSWLTRSLKKPTFYILLVALCGGGYLLSDILTPRCMYWGTDRYVLISCRQANTIGVDTLVIPRDPDTEKLRRIMQPDTLTKKAVRRIWYVKISADSIEFFNRAGFHPVYTEKKLRPVTEYILSKYVWEQ